MQKINFPIEDNVLLFFTLLFIILIAPMVTKKLKLPGIVGIIIGGALVGPNGLNLISMSPAIQLLGSIGLLYIMFIAGLEINLLDFKRNKEKSIVFGLITFAIPQIVGTLLFLMLGFSWLTSLLVASMFASHTLVGYPIITKLGIVRNRAVLTTVGGTILADTLALLVLAIIARSAVGELNTRFWISLTVLSAIYSFIMIYLLPKLGRLFFKYSDDGFVQFQFVIAVAFLASFLAKVIGIEPIVGAFFAGLVLNRMIPSSSQLMNRVQFIGQSLFIPFFLLYIGMIVDISVLLNSVKSWLVMFAMLSTNVATKAVSAFITRKIFKFTKAEGMIIFGLTTTEAAATLAAALVGYRLKIIGDDILNGVILMILITCILGPMIVEKFGKKIAFENAGSSFNKISLPHMIVSLSNPNTLSNLLSIAIILKGKYVEKISALTIITDKSKLDENIDNADKLLEAAVEYTNSAGITINSLKRIDTNAANGIFRTSLEEQADLLLLGWNGKHTTKEYIFGSVLDQILEHCHQTVLVSKLNCSLLSNTRIMFYVPAFFSNEPAIFNTIKIVMFLAKGMNAPLHVYSDEFLIDLIKDKIKQSKTEIEIRYNILTDIEEDFELFAKNSSENDLIITCSARKNNLSWKQNVDQLPKRIATVLDKNNFIIIYPGFSYNSSDEIEILNNYPQNDRFDKD